ncbi:uncharacterized protein LOC131045172 isoform X2 [Cryptomeria japonica]|uniref:uncharacterized protein LOC131045172 isoform X2 n=1 Tax=Cryptomeria japonica TaxID=3369 RepID=UPI0025AD62A9|nr:uncharacterized protein LOC131045172 isoform X2 [Cryptomeria japonica]
MENAKKHLTSQFEDKKLLRGHVVCTWTVPARLTDASGALYAGVIATIVDDIGCVASLSDSQPQKVSVDMNISYISTAKVNDEIEVDARVLGHKGGFSMTYVNLKNKATGETIAEGRHSLYGRQTSKL